MKPRSATSASIPAATTPRTESVRVDIDELVLVGFDRAGAAELAGEIHNALTRELAEKGPPAWWTEAEYSAADHPHGDRHGGHRQLAQLEVSIAATDSPAAIAETLATQICAGPTTDDGGQP